MINLEIIGIGDNQEFPTNANPFTSVQCQVQTAIIDKHGTTQPNDPAIWFILVSPLGYQYAGAITGLLLEQLHADYMNLKKAWFEGVTPDHTLKPPEENGPTLNLN